MNAVLWWRTTNTGRIASDWFREVEVTRITAGRVPSHWKNNLYYTLCVFTGPPPKHYQSES